MIRDWKLAGLVEQTRRGLDLFSSLEQKVLDGWMKIATHYQVGFRRKELYVSWRRFPAKSATPAGGTNLFKYGYKATKASALGTPCSVTFSEVRSS